MKVIADIVMAIWIPAVLVLFALLGSRRAVIVTFLGAWLFLPMVNYSLPGLPDYSKMSATCAGIFLATIIFDVKRVVRFKPSWADVPMFVYCICPSISSLLNGLGEWDAVSATVGTSITWGLPYFIGRIYFNDAKSLRQLATAMLIGGLLYVPLCLFEVRMSPQLHSLFYGFAPRGVQMRYGGWRPAVFMDGGLQVGMWMTAASLIGVWVWFTKSLPRLWGWSTELLLAPLLVTTVLCRATGALALLLIGLASMWISFRTKSRIALVLLLLVAPCYLMLRASDVWHGEPLLTMAGWIDSDRAGSLEFRFKNEDMLAARALQRPWFGWGGWGRSRIHDEWGKDISVTDGLWIITLGDHGIVGLTSCFATMLLPLALLTSRFKMSRLTSGELAAAFALAVIVCLYAIDCLPNAMVNPVFTLAGGGVTSFALVSWRSSKAGHEESAVHTRESAISGGTPQRKSFPTYT